MMSVVSYQKTQKATQERDPRERRHRERRVSNRAFHDAMLAQVLSRSREVGRPDMLLTVLYRFMKMATRTPATIKPTTKMIWSQRGM